jgi:hypothetical protein
MAEMGVRGKGENAEQSMRIPLANPAPDLPKCPVKQSTPHEIRPKSHTDTQQNLEHEAPSAATEPTNRSDSSRIQSPTTKWLHYTNTSNPKPPTEPEPHISDEEPRRRRGGRESLLPRAPLARTHPNGYRRDREHSEKRKVGGLTDAAAAGEARGRQREQRDKREAGKGETFGRGRVYSGE